MRRGSAGRVDYGTRADLRYRVRRFLRVREELARAAGLEPQQYLLLLQVKGIERARVPTIGVLAERLQIRHHATVQLVDRLVDRGLVRRRRAEADRRAVVVEVTPRGGAVLRKLTIHSLAELQEGAPALAAALGRLIGENSSRRSEERRVGKERRARG